MKRHTKQNGIEFYRKEVNVNEVNEALSLSLILYMSVCIYIFFFSYFLHTHILTPMVYKQVKAVGILQQRGYELFYMRKVPFLFKASSASVIVYMLQQESLNHGNRNDNAHFAVV